MAATILYIVLIIAVLALDITLLVLMFRYRGAMIECQTSYSPLCPTLVCANGQVLNPSAAIQPPST